MICDSAKFGLFLMLFNSLYKLALCLLRRLFKSDRIAAPIAGFISALSIAFDSKNRRTLFVVLTLSRMIETSCNAIDAERKLPYREICLWSISCTFTMFVYSVEADTINRGVAKYFHMMSQPTENDLIFREVWHRMWEDGQPTF